MWSKNNKFDGIKPKSLVLSASFLIAGSIVFSPTTPVNAGLESAREACENATEPLVMKRCDHTGNSGFEGRYHPHESGVRTVDVDGVHYVARVAIAPEDVGGPQTYVLQLTAYYDRATTRQMIARADKKAELAGTILGLFIAGGAAAASVVYGPLDPSFGYILWTTAGSGVLVALSQEAIDSFRDKKTTEARSTEGFCYYYRGDTVSFEDGDGREDDLNAEGIPRRWDFRRSSGWGWYAPEWSDTCK